MEQGLDFGYCSTKVSPELYQQSLIDCWDILPNPSSTLACPRHWCRLSSRDCLALLKYRSMELRFWYSSFHALLNRGIIPMIRSSLPVGFSQCVSLQ